jgi:hypothetical protein
MGCCVLAGACALALFSGAARADKASEARQHYESATSHFAVGEFAQAAEEYQEAFKLKRDPALLYNAAQAHRLAGNHEKALILYRNYLQLYPNEKNLGEVRSQIAKLKEAVAASDKAKTAPPMSTVEPRPVSGMAASSRSETTRPETSKPETARSESSKPAVASKPEPATPPARVDLTPPPPERERPIVVERTPVYKKWWLWTIIGGVVVVGTAVALAVVFTRPGPWSNAPDVLGPGVTRSALVQW